MDTHFSSYAVPTESGAYLATDMLLDEDGPTFLVPTGTIPMPLRSRDLDSPVARWWVPALAGELRAPADRNALARSPAILRHRTEEDVPDPLIIPSEWGVF
jgi:hypothetical protein